MTTWLVILWLASGETRAMPQAYASEADCSIAADITARRARILHAIDPTLEAVAHVSCERVGQNT